MRRSAILAFLNAEPDEYSVVLTANTTAACRLVGESFRFGAEAPLILAADNHNSVNGLREFARRSGAAVHTLPLDDELRSSPRALSSSGRRAGGWSPFRRSRISPACGTHWR